MNEFKKMDQMGIVCSSACLAHCLLPSIVMYLSPTLSSYLQNEWIHIGLLCLVVPISIATLLSSKKRHEETAPLIVGLLGIFFLLFTIVNEHLLSNESKSIELALTTIGSSLLIISHILNIRYASHLRKVQKQA